VLHVKEAQAAELPPHAAHAASLDTVPARDTAVRGSDSAASPALVGIRAMGAKRDSLRRGLFRDAAAAAARGPAAMVRVPGTTPFPPPPQDVRPGTPAQAPRVVPVLPIAPAPAPGGARAQAAGDAMPNLDAARVAEAKLRLELAQRSRNRYDIEIHKKFSLAAACLIFSVLGAPLAVRFPRGGVGLVLGVSLLVFALYYVGLIGGEALANEGKVPPFWAMWGTNVILTAVGIVMLLRMGKDQNTGRGGDWADRMDVVKGWFGRGPRARRPRGA
jgi:lipopolysaccharide export system permease protein